MSSRKGLCSLIQLGALLFFNDIGETQHLMEKQARSVDVRRRRNPDGRGHGTACLSPHWRPKEDALRGRRCISRLAKIEKTNDTWPVWAMTWAINTQTHAEEVGRFWGVTQQRVHSVFNTHVLRPATGHLQACLSGTLTRRTKNSHRDSV